MISTILQETSENYPKSKSKIPIRPQKRDFQFTLP